MKEKSKIIKLKNKQKRLKFWHNWGGWILCANALIPIMLLVPCVMANITPTLALLESLYLGFSVLASFEHELFGEKKIKQKIQDLDQQILHLVKTDEEEMKILREHDKIEDLQKEINLKQQELKKQRELVKALIKDNTTKVKAQQNYIKELTSKKKKSAKAEAIKEAEEVLQPNEFLETLHFD